MSATDTTTDTSAAGIWVEETTADGTKYSVNYQNAEEAAEAANRKEEAGAGFFGSESTESQTVNWEFSSGQVVNICGITWFSLARTGGPYDRELNFKCDGGQRDYFFTDENGETYWKSVVTGWGGYTLRYGSSKPKIVKVTVKKTPIF